MRFLHGGGGQSIRRGRGAGAWGHGRSCRGRSPNSPKAGGSFALGEGDPLVNGPWPHAWGGWPLGRLARQGFSFDPVTRAHGEAEGEGRQGGHALSASFAPGMPCAPQASPAPLAAPSRRQPLPLHLPYCVMRRRPFSPLFPCHCRTLPPGAAPCPTRLCGNADSAGLPRRPSHAPNAPLVTRPMHGFTSPCSGFSFGSASEHGERNPIRSPLRSPA